MTRDGLCSSLRSKATWRLRGKWGHFLYLACPSSSTSCRNGSALTRRLTSTYLCGYLYQTYLRNFGMIMLSKIASAIGKPVSVDFQTICRKRVGHPRVQVIVDATKSVYMVLNLRYQDGEMFNQKLDYEYAPKYCMQCKRFGHLSFSCNGPVAESVHTQASKPRHPSHNGRAPPQRQQSRNGRGPPQRQQHQHDRVPPQRHHSRKGGAPPTTNRKRSASVVGRKHNNHVNSAEGQRGSSRQGREPQRHWQQTALNGGAGLVTQPSPSVTPPMVVANMDVSGERSLESVRINDHAKSLDVNECVNMNTVSSSLVDSMVDASLVGSDQMENDSLDESTSSVVKECAKGMEESIPPNSVIDDCMEGMKDNSNIIIALPAITELVSTPDIPNGSTIKKGTNVKGGAKNKLQDANNNMQKSRRNHSSVPPSSKLDVRPPGTSSKKKK